MAHKAQLKIEKDYDLIECEYEFIQAIKDNGQPAGRPTGGLIHITLEAPDDGDLRFHEWMQSATEHKNGQIIFEVSGDEKPLIRTLKFKRAYCIRLYEYFNSHNGRMQMLTKITISAAEITFGDEKVIFKNDQK